VTLYCATTNAGKLREFRAAAPDDIDIQPLPGLKQLPACEETGATFEENAVQKARHYSRYCNGDLFAEDSGLEVDALEGAPGVYSARFAGPGATDEQNNALLLERMTRENNRTARYVCIIVLARRGEVLQTFRGEVERKILETYRGAGGFGYDPLFFFEQFNRTFAEIPLAEKQTVSHRGRALKLMLTYVRGTLV
jgi:XTP/dITP diphosphohydrolase